jgi:hypothetical protein
VPASLPFSLLGSLNIASLPVPGSLSSTMAAGMGANAAAAGMVAAALAIAVGAGLLVHRLFKTD